VSINYLLALREGIMTRKITLVFILVVMVLREDYELVSIE
jgi:hypothetical protein